MPDNRLEKAMRQIARQKERAVMRAFYGDVGASATITSNVSRQEPLTLNTIGKIAANMRAAIGPTLCFLSSELFPDDKAFSVENSTTKFVCAGPRFWTRLQAELRRDAAPPPLGGTLMPMHGIQIVEIDEDENDSEDRRRYLSRIWAELREAIEVAMVPLPDWLGRKTATD